METRNTKIAVVTGGSRGLGKDMAQRIADRGIDVILTYHSNKEEAEKVVRHLEAKGRKAATLQLKVEDASSFAQFADELTSILKSHFNTNGFDYLVNNAGIGLNAPVNALEEETFDRLMNIHLKGPQLLTKTLLPTMNDGGGIVNISTGLARFSLPGYGTYASMKAGMEAYTRYLAKELGPRGIKANSVAPGAIATDFGGGVVRDNEDVNKYIASTIALGRVGQASDIGGVVAFLCTDDAQWVNAQRIEVSGGQMI
ncbi:MAG: SDR family oxidoreductase [Bacteroidota bacterium]